MGTAAFTKIKKRDGREVAFDSTKISDAIYKAMVASGSPRKNYDIAKELSDLVVDTLQKELGEGVVPEVEQIQDMVERVLVEKGHVRTAKEFILYRAGRTRVREMNTKLMKIYEDLTFKPAIDVDIKRENANIDGNTAMGTMLKYGSEGAKQFYEMYILDPAHSKAHVDGDIHIHDLDFLTLTTTCCQIDIEKLFSGGFSTGHGRLREPNSINSYAALACIAIQANQNDQHGGQSIPNFDYGMAGGVKKTYAKNYRINMIKLLEIETGRDDCAEIVENVADELKAKGILPVLANDNDYAAAEAELLKASFDGAVVEKAQKLAVKYAEKETDRATYQAMEALIHNLNTMNSRAGAQVPFSSLNYGTDTTAEGRMVIKNLLLAQEAGLGNGETPIFPIHIFKVKEGVNYNPEDPNYDLFKLACRVSAKRLYPNFSFIDAPFNIPYYKPGNPDSEVAYMGCRTRVMANVYDRTHETVSGRGNLSFTSINLPRLAILANGYIDGFFEALDRKMALVCDQLLARYKIQADKRVYNYPFLMGQGIWLGSDALKPEDKVGEILKHGTLSVGFIGLAECLKALIGKHHGESREAQNLGLEIVGYMRRYVDKKCEETGLNFSLLATPAEGLSGRFIRIDKKRFGVIEGVTERDYYTNSFHVPVYYPISAFEKIQIEAPYHELTNAGHISYIEVDGDPTKNIDAFEQIVRCMKESGIGYGAINHPVDQDPECGYVGIIDDVCPGCGRKEGEGAPIERIRRITGYLVGTMDKWNNAKRAEEHDRVKHADMEGSGFVEV